MTQVKQALEQERDKTEKLARELTTDLAQVKQTLQQERDKSQKAGPELATDLTQVSRRCRQTEMQSGGIRRVAGARSAPATGGSRSSGRQPRRHAGRSRTPPRAAETPDPTQAPATGEAATAPLPTSESR